MSELEDVCREAVAIRARGAPLLLATVVRVFGSAYRRVGARMLVAEDQWLAGSVSGGCLERDVLVRGAFRTRDGAPVVVTYDSTDEDEDGWGRGLGCNGVVEVLLERIDDRTELDPLAFAESCFAAEEVGALVTVIASDDPSVRVGARIAARAGELVASSLPSGAVHDWLACSARTALDALAESDGGPTQIERGGVVALVERFTPSPRLFVVGSRHDAAPLVAFARALGLHVTVIDAAIGKTTRARLSLANRVLVATPERLRELIDAHPHARAAVVLMTHVFDRDRAYLAAALTSHAAYVGVLGARGRTRRLLDELRIGPGEEPSRLHAPAGLDLGGESPREIALAIVAEVQAAFTGASASRLRDLSGPIHRAEASSPVADAPAGARESGVTLALGVAGDEVMAAPSRSRA